ncbi:MULTISPECIES: ATP-binding protein [unclassified Leptolyngbya]|uniref:ATP-binding protein n=1 Tax=unclassified Leptolyngbya TaxID=2650499 RepID=UPI00168933C9|nr:anti-sigma regulatory factor [Leptolyngbya sp. FACHB-8]MBD2154784.1 anti-sigma regulatory factor [Leptolyngbya sp. FACHB-16]
MFRRTHITVSSDLSVINDVQDWFRQFCNPYVRDFNWLKQQFYPLHLALTEGFSNAVRHAHQELPSETEIDLDLALWNDRIEIRIWDRGEPFDPNSIEEPELGVPRLGGYGWFLIRRLADKAVYERSQDGRNCLVIVKQGEEN